MPKYMNYLLYTIFLVFMLQIGLTILLLRPDI